MSDIGYGAEGVVRNGAQVGECDEWKKERRSQKKKKKRVPEIRIQAHASPSDSSWLSARDSVGLGTLVKLRSQNTLVGIWFSP